MLKNGYVKRRFINWAHLHILLTPAIPINMTDQLQNSHGPRATLAIPAPRHPCALRCPKNVEAQFEAALRRSFSTGLFHFCMKLRCLEWRNI